MCLRISTSDKAAIRDNNTAVNPILYVTQGVPIYDEDTSPVTVGEYCTDELGRTGIMMDDEYTIRSPILILTSTVRSCYDNSNK